MPYESPDQREWRHDDPRVLRTWITPEDYEHILDNAAAQDELEAYLVSRRDADPKIDTVRLIVGRDGPHLIELEWASVSKCVGWWPPAVAARAGRG